MYTSIVTKERIKSLCKERGIPLGELLTRCSLGKNAIQQINETNGMSSVSLAKIADELHCSVDYLLGRTDKKETPAEAGVKESYLNEWFARLSPQNRKLLEDLLQSMLAQQETET